MTATFIVLMVFWWQFLFATVQVKIDAVCVAFSPSVCLQVEPSYSTISTYSCNQITFVHNAVIQMLDKMSRLLNRQNE